MDATRLITIVVKGQLNTARDYFHENSFELENFLIGNLLFVHYGAMNKEQSVRPDTENTLVSDSHPFPPELLTAKSWLCPPSFANDLPQGGRGWGYDSPGIIIKLHRAKQKPSNTQARIIM